MDELIRSAGSFRRLMEQYWTGQLTPEQERVIEDANPKATLASYKPTEREQNVEACPAPMAWTDAERKAAMERLQKSGKNRALEALYVERV